ncbi:DUF7662 domain-containing protein [Sphingorhabdus sp.]|uniref:DUF7662 domain-containing protein n=1 Tax=Sphingorhabdus sp. TaxID=1902408 RepID=UPI003D816069
MSKTYKRLGKFLDDQTSDHVALSFDQIEQIIHRKLPKSARTYDAWWSNSPVEGRHNETWLKRGWATVDINRKSSTVKFIRSTLPARRQKPLRTKAERRAIADGEQVTILKAAPTAAAHDIALAFEWKMLGNVILDANGNVAFPSVTNGAGLYRLRLDGIDRSQVYIGESVNLRRRFGNYRGPGPTQQTSLRINALLKESIAAGAVIAVDIVTEDVKLSINGVQVSVDLTDKAMRRMIEHAAIVATGGTDIEIANR